MPSAASFMKVSVVAELDVAFVAEHGLVGKLDADRARALGVVAEQRLLEQELGHALRGRLEVAAGDESHGVFRLGKELRRREHLVEAGDIGAGRLGHGLLGRRLGLHGLHRVVPDAGEGFAEVRIVREDVRVDDHDVDDLAGNLEESKTRLASGIRIVETIGFQVTTAVTSGRRRRHVGVGGVDDRMSFSARRRFRAPAPAGSARRRARRG